MGAIKLNFCLLLSFILVLSTGCDNIKKVFGLPTAADIEQMQQQIESVKQEQLAREKVLKDSIRTAIQDSIKMAINVDGQNSQLDNYYLVIGCFKKEENAVNLYKLAKEQGFNPKRLKFKNGYEMVAIGGYKTITEAHNVRLKIEYDDICPWDIWVYSIKDRLHLE